MRVLVIGASGMLGHKVVSVLSSRFEVGATVRNRLPVLPSSLGLKPSQLYKGVQAEDFDSIVKVVAAFKPHAVINCVGVIKQHTDAQDPIKCVSINSLFPHRLAALCASAGARLVHISTDCVFSGNKGAYVESDHSDAQDLYGKSKFLGEVTVAGAITLRTSIIGRELESRYGLVEWFLTQKGRQVRGFKWAIFSGLTTLSLSRVIACVIADHPNLHGLWHVAADPIDKHALLTLLNNAYRTNTTINPEDGALKCDRSLNGSRFRQATGILLPSWPQLIDEMAQDSAAYAPVEEYSS